MVKSKYPDKVQFIFRQQVMWSATLEAIVFGSDIQQVQPWHPSSTLVHEAGLAVLKTNPDKFWDFSKALFDKQTDYFDVNVVNETRNKTYERLAKLAEEVGVDSKKVYSLLEVSDKPDKDGGVNIGNQVTDDLKIVVKVCKKAVLFPGSGGALTRDRSIDCSEFTSVLLWCSTWVIRSQSLDVERTNSA